MNTDAKYYLLDTLGILQWLPRTSDAVLGSDDPVFCATCLVLMPQAPPEKKSEQHKILTGMLKVLQQPADQIGIAWVNDAKIIYPGVLSKAIAVWAPYSLLILGQQFSEKIVQKDPHFLDLDIPVQITYHPEELQTNPHHKKQAYADLLQLKEKLKKVNYG